MTREEAQEFDLFDYNGDMTFVRDCAVQNRIDKIFDNHEAELKAKDEKIADLLESHEYFVSEKNRTKRFVPPYEIDELKSRTCEGCKYLLKGGENWYMCNNGISLNTCEEISLDFCCNKWESKNDTINK